MTTAVAPRVRWLHRGPLPIEAVGGKAARLSRLAGRLRVPPGFCLAAGDGGDGGGPLPPAVADGLADAYRELGRTLGTPAPRVAVRSTAVAEDGATASWAGQFATELDVASLPALTAAVARVLDSARGARAAAYAARVGGTAAAPRMAVLVQEMIAADAAAVAFTADPVAGDRHEIIVEACWGLGSALADGWVTPDRFRLRRGDAPRIVDTRCGEKRWMAVAAAAGVERVEVPIFLSRRAALEPPTVVEVARAALTAESVFGCPVDVECAVRDGAVHVLQCRPITGAAAGAG